MTDFLRNRINRGIVTAIIVFFLELIGFTVVISTMIGKLAGVRQASGPIFFIIFLAIIGIINGSGVRKYDHNDFKESALGGVISGLAAGILIGISAFFLGVLNNQGLNLREYFVQLSSGTVEFYLFDMSPAAGAVTHLVIYTLSGLIGGILGYSSSKGHFSSSITSKSSSILDRIRSSRFVRHVADFKYSKYLFLALMVAVLVIFPRVAGSYWNYILGTVGIYVLLGLGLNIIVGYSGQLVLGYVAFFAMGAYTFALLSAPVPHNINMNFWPALLFGILAAALTGVLLGLPILNLRGDYLAIVTLGFGEIIRNLIRSDIMTPITLGPRGVRQIAEPTLFGRAFSTDVDYMYIIIISVILLIFITNRIQNSRVGRAWLAIKDDQTVAQANGINTYRYKLLALTIGAAFAGLAGVIFAARNQFTGPEDHVLMVSINVLCLVIVGGMGSIPGVILGSFVLKGIPEMLRDLEIYRMLFFGVLLVIMMIVRPEGLWPVGRPVLEKFTPSSGGALGDSAENSEEGVQHAG